MLLITAVKLCNCFKVTIGLMMKYLSGFLPLWQLRGRTQIVIGVRYRDEVVIQK
jgi:hypothetical protein